MSVKVSVLGAGSWGTALAMLLASKYDDVILWEFRPDVASELATLRENKLMLPGVPIPEKIHITSDFEKSARYRDVLVLAVPSHIMRKVAERLREVDFGKAILVSVAKGIENDTLLRMSQVIQQVLPELPSTQLAVLSGPSHAEEVARKIPTTVVSASSNLKTAQEVQRIFMTSNFRVYASEDLIGVELGGSLKNIIAIGAGISDGVGYGDNTKAALMTRGLVEITRLGTAMGADPMTFAGLSGMGDLIVTCMSRHSRNRYLGEQIGKGKTLQQVLDEMVMVAEGVRTTRSAHDLAQKYGVEMPITEQVFKVLFEDKPPKEAVIELMERGAKVEKWG